jgi:hypothetical protein
MQVTLLQILGQATVDYLKGKWGGRWITALGNETNKLTTWAKDGVKSRMPTIAPSGALQYLSRERGIERAPGESDASFRIRLHAAWDTWKWSGTDLGVYYGLEACGFEIGKWSLEPWFSWPSTWPETGHVWIFSYNAVAGESPDDFNDPLHAGRAWIVADGYAHGVGYSTQVVGDGSVVGGGETITIDTPFVEVERWRQSVRKWKGSHVTYPKMFIIMSSGGWGDIIAPFGTIVGGGQVINGEVEEIIIGEAIG